MFIWRHSLHSSLVCARVFLARSLSLFQHPQCRYRDYSTAPPIRKFKNVHWKTKLSEHERIVGELKKIASKRKRKLDAKLEQQEAEDSSSAPILDKRRTSPFIKNEWEGEDWKSGWGEDELRPSTGNSRRIKRYASKTHQNYPIAYTRRIEGLIEPSGKPVLTGQFRWSRGSINLTRAHDTDLPPLHEQRPVATLAHGLDRVLFNPGVHWLQDPRSRVYNFTPWLESIPKVDDFAFERLTRTLAGSTSSLTGMLSQIYFLISGDKYVDTQTLSRSFWSEPRHFTPGQRMPSTVVFNHKDGTYAIDSESDKAGHAEKNILTWMGTLLEKYLTMSPEDFTACMRSSPPQEQVTDPTKDAFRYAKSDRFVMRSQLDCQDTRLPGSGVFDIKTRACLPIRLDILNFEEHSGYLIRSQYGTIESFEKEYYDLIRSAFLKYSFQVRIGNMDARIFGFQYVPLAEMEERLFGPGRGIGDKVFERCVRLLEIVCQEVVQCFPGEPVRCTFETKEYDNKLNVWVEPTKWAGKGERPIQQLEVRVANYIGVSEVPGFRAISACDSGDAIWSVHWTVCRLSDNDQVIRSALRGAKERQFRAYNFPTGVDASEMPEFWAGLNFGRAGGKSRVAYRTEHFQSASASIQRLRELSRAGREESDRIAAVEAGKPKIVYTS
ncbi:hypothetical protein M378DRAFT_177093 [Amanita muscaria Koide BX008]|uniref:Uncharacterized protein n=1 Tax=Amanita muscaria (strain Koide BX008) TaxID=946122 RepID=A0A0C2TL49_AMAMK|nr:hypothetical protein M378DRAFT_177093 [Amanita muscaria Koide BX008]